MPGRQHGTSAPSQSRDAPVFVPGAKYHYVNSYINDTSLCFHRSGPELGVSSSSGSRSYPAESDVQYRKRLFIRGACTQAPALSSFLNAELSELVQPLWNKVALDRRSHVSVLPEVCATTIITVPGCWSQDKKYGFVLCKTFSGLWTLVNTSELLTRTGCSEVPEALMSLTQAINRIPSKSASSILFDDVTNDVYVSEIEWCSDKIALYRYSREEGEFRFYTSMDSLPSGAISVHFVSNGLLVFSIGSCVFGCQLERSPEGPRKIYEGTPSGGDGIPVSVQSVVPVLTSSGRLISISGGRIVSTELASGKTTSLLSHAHVQYVATACDTERMRAVFIGFEQKGSEIVQYITIVDLVGEFVVSTQTTKDFPHSSIIAVAVDPVDSNVVVLGRSNHVTRRGAITYTFPAVYN